MPGLPKRVTTETVSFVSASSLSSSILRSAHLNSATAYDLNWPVTVRTGDLHRSSQPIAAGGLSPLGALSPLGRKRAARMRMIVVADFGGSPGAKSDQYRGLKRENRGPIKSTTPREGAIRGGPDRWLRMTD